MDAQLALMLVTDRIAESHRQAAHERLVRQARHQADSIDVAAHVASDRRTTAARLTITDWAS